MEIQYMLLTLCVAIIIPNNQGEGIGGYYWREYAGIVPSDAFIGGHDHDGNPIYVGQTMFDGEVVNGKIYTGDNRLHFSIQFRAFTTTNFIKILCTQKPETLVWILVKIGAAVHKDEHHFIVGGYYGEAQLNYYISYIGRIFYHGETSVIQVRSFNNKFTDFGYSKESVFTKFKMFKFCEVLTYVPPTATVVSTTTAVVSTKSPSV